MAKSTTIHHLDFICTGWVGNYIDKFVSFVFNFEDYEREQDIFTQHLSEAERSELEELLGEDFLEPFFEEHGHTWREITFETHPETGDRLHGISVRVSDEEWKSRVDASVIAGFKERAERFFTVYFEHLPTYEAREGSFVALKHRRAVTEVAEELL